jgi:hypothetical protein
MAAFVVLATQCGMNSKHELEIAHTPGYEESITYSVIVESDPSPSLGVGPTWTRFPLLWTLLDLHGHLLCRSKQKRVLGDATDALMAKENRKVSPGLHTFQNELATLTYRCLESRSFAERTNQANQSAVRIVLV